MNESHAIMFLAGVLFAGTLALAVDNRDKPADAEDAVRLCEETGGTLLVTEYNSVTGLTLNCFYPVEDVGIAPEPESITL